MTKYLVHLPDSRREVDAETVNLDQQKLWFYDQDRHLIAVFVWEKIVGVEVIGSAQEQKFTDDLLHEESAANERREAEIRKKGALWGQLREVVEQLDKIASTLRWTWLQFENNRRTNQTELDLLVQRHGADLRQLEAQLADRQKAVNSSIQHILDEFRDLFSNGKK
jgi:hypothetical protein